MRCLSPSLIHTAQGPMKVPCNRCMACRINKGQEWTLRVLYELETNGNKGCFATLTFDPEYEPPDGSLRKKDVQNFNKRVRKYFFGNGKSEYKYFACGEYGPKTFRPHYHVAMLGVDIPFSEWIFVRMENGKPVYTSPTLSKLWPYGFNTIGFLEKASINYVTGYIQKKMYGKAAKLYEDLGVIPPFQLASTYLGVGFVMEQADRIFENGFVSWYGKKMPIPKYYSRKIGLSDQVTDEGVNLRSQLAYDSQNEAMREWMDKTGKSEFEYAEYVISARLQKKKDMAAREAIMQSRSKL